MRPLLLSMLLFVLLPPLLRPQNQNHVLLNHISNDTKIPQYLVYRHFLAWVNALDKEQSADSATDLYAFAEPFAAQTRLARADIDLVRAEAQALTADLNKQDAKASTLIAAFREKAKMAAQLGKPLPPIPAQIHQLQQERTALIVQHMINLRTRLGPVASSTLDNYISREFAPHISLKAVARRASDLTVDNQGKAFVIGLK